MDISEKILITRKEKGFTQQILADKANLSLSTIKRIENGKVVPRVYTLNYLIRNTGSRITSCFLKQRKK